MNVMNISAGVSSAVAGYMWRDQIDKFIYIDIENQHPDSLRFISDFENWIDREVEVLMSPYKNVENVIKQFKYINGPAGARCSNVLKRRVRKAWEVENPGHHNYVWGMDLNEHTRALQLRESIPNHSHYFPLIAEKITKEQAHFMVEKAGIKRPAMYYMGYPNNNCIGCVKGGCGYWNKIRVDFPDVFWSMAALEREIGATCIKDKNGRVWLDELDPERGRGMVIIPSCSSGYCATFGG